MKKIFLLMGLSIFILLASCQSTDPSRSLLRDLPRENRTTVMVLNFKNHSIEQQEKYTPWELGIPSMIMTDLELIGVFNIMSRERMGEILEQQNLQLSGLVDESKAVEIGKLAAAQFLISGNYMIMGIDLRLEVNVTSIETGQAFKLELRV